MYLWQTKRHQLSDAVGFVDVPKATAAALVAAGAAQEVYDMWAFIDNTPLGPEITAINAAVLPITDASPVSTPAANLTVVGGTAPITYAFVSNPNSNFKIAGAAIQTNKLLAAGSYNVRVRATDSTGETATSAVITIVVTEAVAPPAVQAT